jgi:hypothetical protein
LHGQIGIRKMDLDAALREKRVADKEPIPKAFDKTVQSVLNQHTSQSKVFRKKNKRANDDLFYSPKGKHSGTWALRGEIARFESAIGNACLDTAGFMLATDGNLGVVEHSARARNYRADKDLRHHKAKQPPMM